jgi:hypothetical protein
VFEYVILKLCFASTPQKQREENKWEFGMYEFGDWCCCNGCKLVIIYVLPYHPKDRRKRLLPDYSLIRSACGRQQQ